MAAEYMKKIQEGGDSVIKVNKDNVKTFEKQGYVVCKKEEYTETTKVK